MPTVSVIIPAYNRAHLVMRAINSVLNQTFQDFEIIIVDDASRDNTEELVRGIHDKRIFYIQHEKNRGGSAARNTGIKQARGEYIAFLDSDDEWLPEKLEKQLKVFEQSTNSVGLVYTGIIKESKQRRSVHQSRENTAQAILAENYVGTTSTPLIKKECFLKTGLFDETLPSAQDWDMWIRIGQYYEFDFVTEQLVKYYLQDDSITRNREAKIEAYRIISKKYKNSIKNLPKRVKAEHYFYLGKMFWWRRKLAQCCRYFIKSISTHPALISEIGIFFMQRAQSKIIKLIVKIKKLCI